VGSGEKKRKEKEASPGAVFAHGFIPSFRLYGSSPGNRDNGANTSSCLVVERKRKEKEKEEKGRWRTRKRKARKSIK